MLKIGSKSAALLMLLGATTGTLAGTTASAMSKSTKKTLTTLQKKEEKVTTTSKKVDSELDKVGVKGLFALTLNSYDGTLPDYTQVNTFKLSQPLVVSNQFRKKTVTLPAKTVVNGNIDSLKFIGVNNLDLSKKNQRKVFSALGNKYESSVSLSNTGNADKNGNKILTIYTRNTAFSKNGQRNLPDLSAKSLNSYYDADKSNVPFITVTSDNYLNYYSSAYKVGATANYAKISQSIKIKKLTRSGSSYIYYLAKPLTGFGATKTRVGKTYQYKLKVSLGHVFRSYDNYNLDPGGYRITVKVGSKNFYVNLGNVAETYLGNLRNDKYVTNSVKPAEAQKYIDGLQ